MRARIYVVRLAVVLTMCFSQAACSAQTQAPSSALPPVAQLDVRHVASPRVSLGKFTDPYAVGVDPRCSSNCDVYVADPGARTVWLVKPDGSKHVFANTSMLGASFDPQGVAVSPRDGSIVIADKQNYHTESIVWRISNGSATSIPGFDFRFHDPLRRMFARGVAVGPFGEVYVAMAQWGFLIDTGFGSQCLGHCWYSGLAQTGTSYGITVDSAQTVWVAATRFKGVFIGTAAKRSYHGWIDIGDPYGVAATWTGGHVVIADPLNKRVWYYRSDGSLIDLGAFVDPYGVAVDGAGHVYVADAGAKEVFKIKL